MYPPTEEGWGLFVYFCDNVENNSAKKEEGLKRKTDSDSDVDVNTKKLKVIVSRVLKRK